MFGGKDKVASTPQDNKPSHLKAKNDHTEATIATGMPNEEKIEESSEDTSRPILNKAVSFSKIPPQVKEYEKEEHYEELDDNEDSPVAWHDEHKEALILVAVAGLLSVSVMALKRFIR